MSEQLAHCATYSSLTIELLKMEEKENYTVIGYVNIKQKNGDILVRILEHHQYMIDREHAIKVYRELKEAWGMGDDAYYYSELYNRDRLPRGASDEKSGVHDSFNE